LVLLARLDVLARPLHRPLRRKAALRISLLLLVNVAAAPPFAPASADPAEPIEAAPDDWRAARTRLEALGVALELSYTGESLFALRGGRNRGGEYRGNVDLVVELDFEKLGIWRGGRLVVYGQNGHGRGISELRVGDVQTLSNLDAHRFTQLSECWLEQRLLEDRVRVKLGKQDANADFSASNFASDFLNSSFGAIPTVPMPTFPHPALGVSLFAEPAKWISLGMGIFDGGGGAFTLIEGTLRSTLGRSSLPGRHRAGLWYHSGKWEELSGSPEPGAHSGNYGVYAYSDQILYAEPGTRGEEGLGVFGQLGWAPRDRNEVTLYLGGGLSYQGLLPRRAEDAVGLGVAHARLSGRLRGENRGKSETAIELFYRAQLGSRVSMQPDLQLILHPGGEQRNAIAAGLRFELRL
jgi:porin